MSAPELARHLGNGSTRIMVEPRRKLQWHKPSVYVPALQWTARMGITRYEWARRDTPADQRAFFEHLARLYRLKTPQPMPRDLLERLHAAKTVDEQGMEVFADFGKFREEIDKYEINTTDPTGEWRFHVYAEQQPDGTIMDRLACSCCDYRTLPDWELMVRLRSWVLDDTRDAFMILPGQDINREGWATRYENVRFNNLQWISPRLAVPQGCPARAGEPCVYRSGEEPAKYGPCVHCGQEPS